MVVIVHMDSITYYLAPSTEVEEGKIYYNVSGLSNSSSRSDIVDAFKNNNIGTAISTNYFLENFNETKLLEYNNSSYSVYEYYFAGEYELNSSTGQIYLLEFTMITDENWDSLSY